MSDLDNQAGVSPAKGQAGNSAGWLLEDITAICWQLLRWIPQGEDDPSHVFIQAAKSRLREAGALLDADPALLGRHTDDLAVDHFASAMKTKMAESRSKGRGGWDDPQECTVQMLARMLVSHIKKGDPVDVGNFAMMLHERNAGREVLRDETLKADELKAWRTIQDIYSALHGNTTPWPEDLGLGFAPFGPDRLPARDERGFCIHPDMPDGDEDIDQDLQMAVLGLETGYVHMEMDSQELADAYMENPEVCARWEPSRPQGEGWMLACIYDSEDGPVAMYVRPLALRQSAPMSPKAVWLDLMNVLDADNGHTHDWTNADMQEALQPITRLQNLGFFADDPDDLDGSFWQCAAGEETERREFFARGIEHLEALDKVIHRVFDPEDDAALPAWWDAFILNICELPDRTSPEDEPLAMIATADELEGCALRAIERG